MILLALAALAWNVTPAYSTVITQYNDLASFNVATSGDTTIDFTGMAGDYHLWPGLNGSTGLTDQNGQIDTNVQFIGITGNSNSPYSLNVTNVSGYGWSGTVNALQQGEYPTSAYYIQVNFTAPVTAFGTNVFTSNPFAASFSVTLNGASTPLAAPFTVATIPQPTLAFWGVTSDTPIYSADFAIQGPSSGGTNAFLENFTYGTAQAQAPPPPPDVPEAATMLLIGSGLLGLAILGKKMRPAQFV